MASDESRIDKKLDYVLGTKSLIRQAMINKGIEVTGNTTFREYADLINNLVIERDQTDATAVADDIVAGKIAYNDNNRIIGNMIEYSSLSSQATEIIETNDIITGKIQTDSRTLLGENAKISVDIPLNEIDDYNRALDLVNDILDEN